MTKTIRNIHRYLSLTVALFWLVQLCSGLLLVFQRNLDDVAHPSADTPANFALLENSMHGLIAERPGSRIPFVYAFDARFNSFDVYLVEESGDYRAFRMAGDGTVLRELPSNPEVLDAGFFELVLELHEKLWLGDLGAVILGVSGILLVSNIGFGLWLAWPKRGQWRTAFRWPRKVGGKAGHYALHRMLGLAVAPVAILSIGAGVLLAWEGPIADTLGAHDISPDIPAVETFTGDEIGLSKAVDVAKGLYPEGQVAVFTLATPAKPYYKIRLTQPGELRRLYGKTIVFVSALDGGVIAHQDALTLPASHRFVNSFYAIHSGEYLAIFGRLISFAVGLWLLVMMVFGVRLWWLRR
ncbi:PepSY-associated TM helix domain-containing protein [Kordiimonas sp.]|uniref:PepSY-associated TM helix domain-containing protein n=1 Tax=Kordiimonas sp. TaxID=1970157 RepID=UPI003B52FAA3